MYDLFYLSYQFNRYFITKDVIYIPSQKVEMCLIFTSHASIIHYQAFLSILTQLQIVGEFEF